MSRHLAFACWLHIVAALFVLGCVGVIWVAAAQLAPTFDGTFLPGLVALFGKPVAVALIGSLRFRRSRPSRCLRALVASPA